VSPVLAHARAVADAVLYEGYLLYPYRASASKNQSRWQFGVLGPPGALDAFVGEDRALAGEFLLLAAAESRLTVYLRFLQLQRRSVQERAADGSWIDVAELRTDEGHWLSWDEAVEHELELGTWGVAELASGRRIPVVVPAGREVEPIGGGDGGLRAARLLRTRRALDGMLGLEAEYLGGAIKLSARMENDTEFDGGKHSAIAGSFIGTHLMLELSDGAFVSMTDPPPELAATAGECAQHRCWPVLAGPEGDRSVLLLSPIILYDHPELAPQSAGALFDSTEIDEILTLRILTLTDAEKAAARATDPRAAEIIARCESMSPQAMQRLHGVLREAQHGTEFGLELAQGFGFGDEVPWWDPAVDASVSPETDHVLINGVPVGAGSIVRVHPSRRADAQDLFFAERLARVTAVHSDVDGQTHVALLLLDDPAADLHEWYGRFLYFAPDELEPVSDARTAENFIDQEGWSRS
jgi:hypothetical protein